MSGRSPVPAPPGSEPLAPGEVLAIEGLLIEMGRCPKAVDSELIARTMARVAALPGSSEGSLPAGEAGLDDGRGSASARIRGAVSELNQRPSRRLPARPKAAGRGRGPQRGWALAAAAAAVLACGWWLLRESPSGPELAAISGHPVLLRGEARIAVREGVRLETGDRLETGAGAAVTLRYAHEKTHIELAENSRLGLLDGEGAKRLALDRGRLQAQVAPQPAGWPLVVGTPHARAEVVGTRFTLFVDLERTRLEVQEGQVRLVRSGDGATVLVQGGSSALAPPGLDLAAAQSVSMAPMRTANRTSGVAPLGVFFDAVDTEAPLAWSSGVAQPADGDYASLHYAWDFGDAGAGSWGPSGRSRNRATGYVAAHVFERPGTYRVELKVTDLAGLEHSYFQEITAQEFGGKTYYVSGSSGDDAHDGLSPARALRTADKAFAVLASNCRILFRRGETFPASGPLRIGAPGPGLIGAYGEGARPVLKIEETAGGILLNQADWRIMDLELAGPGRGDGNAAVHCEPRPGADRTLLLRLDCHDFLFPIRTGGIESAGASPPEGIVVADCQVSQASTSGFLVGGRHLALLGNTVRNVAVHGLSVWQGHKCVIGENALWGGSGKEAQALKVFGPTHGQDRPETRYVVVSGNSFTGNTWSVVLGSNEARADQRLSRIILEENRFLANPFVRVGLCLSASEVTVRNNLFLGSGSAKAYAGISVIRYGPVPPSRSVRILNNTFHKPDLASRFAACEVSEDSVDVLFRNNLASAPLIPGALLVSGTCGELRVDRNLLANTPGFVDASQGDLRLAPGSPAIGAGIPQAQVRTDFKGLSRARSGRDDLGALKFQEAGTGGARPSESEERRGPDSF